MQVNLVFSPFALPTPPLGISNLKSYVETRSDHRVRCIDINNVANNMLAESVVGGKIRFKEKRKVTRDGRRLLSILKGRHPAFHNQRQYNEAAEELKPVFTNLYRTINQECGEMAHGRAAVPPYIVGFRDLVMEGKPDLIGFSIMFVEQFFMAFLLARLIKEKDSSIRIALGGNYVENSIFREALKSNFVDFVVLKEGEQSLLALLDALAAGDDGSKVPGVAWLDGDRNVVVNPEAPPLDLDDLPFADFSDLDLSDYFTPEPVLPLLTSRGCYWRRCAFCNHWSHYGATYKVPSVKRVVDEIEHHMQNGVRHFDFVDEMVAPARFRRIGEEIIARGLDISYFGLAMPTKAFDRHTLDIMARSGCKYVLWGFESASQRILDLIDKGTVVADIARVLKESAEAGIRNHLFTIVGFPSETTEDLRATLDFLYHNQDHVDLVMSGRFLLAKDSRVYAHFKDFGIDRVHDGPGALARYDTATGIGYDQAGTLAEYYFNNYFPRFSYFSWFHANFRHHALVHYAAPDKLVLNMKKQPIPDPAEMAPERIAS